MGWSSLGRLSDTEIPLASACAQSRLFEHLVYNLEHLDYHHAARRSRRGPQAHLPAQRPPRQHPRARQDRRTQEGPHEQVAPRTRQATAPAADPQAARRGQGRTAARLGAAERRVPPSSQRQVRSADPDWTPSTTTSSATRTCRSRASSLRTRSSRSR